MITYNTRAESLVSFMVHLLAGYVPKAVLAETNYPLHPNSVPAWSVPLYSLVVPAILMALHSAVLRWAAIFALCTASSRFATALLVGGDLCLEVMC
jgi:hypothetical protein